MTNLIRSVGDSTLVQQSKTSFFASTSLQSDVVMRCYDWATTVRNSNGCIVSGFSSPMERDVLHFLLKGSCPIVIVLARRLYHVIPEEWRPAVDQGRMLIAYTCNQQRQSHRSAMARNQYIADTCDRLVFASITEQSSLYPLTQLFMGQAEIL